MYTSSVNQDYHYHIMFVLQAENKWRWVDGSPLTLPVFFLASQMLGTHFKYKYPEIIPPSFHERTASIVMKEYNYTYEFHQYLRKGDKRRCVAWIVSVMSNIILPKVIDCNVQMDHKGINIQLCNYQQNNEATAAGIRKESGYNLCKPGQFSCFNSSCISDIYVCDGTPDCPNSADETNCLYKHTPPLCEPDCKYFILMSGDIDIIQKNGHKIKFISSDVCTINITLIMNDLYIDCALDIDEHLLFSSDYKKISKSPINGIPCWQTNHPTYFTVDEKCIYDLDVYGKLKLCTDGEHLTDCIGDLNCMNMFRCRNSYYLKILMSHTTKLYC